MMNKMVGSGLILMSLLFNAGNGAAQTYTQMQWGMNKAVIPYAFGANINGGWSNLGSVSNTGAWTLSPTLIKFTTPTGLSQGFNISQNYSGTKSSFAGNEIFVYSDSVNAGATPANTALLIGHRFGGNNLQGGRQSLAVQSVLTSRGSLSNALPEYVAVSGLFQANSSDGGSSFASLSGTRGAGYASNFIARAVSGATFLSELTGAEFNIGLEAGSSAWYASVASFVTRAEHAVHGYYYDASIAISAMPGSVGSNVGILFGPMNGTFPVPSTGTLIGTTNKNRLGSGTIAYTVANAIDFSTITISDCTLKVAYGCVINGNGGIYPKTDSFVPNTAHIYYEGLNGLVITAQPASSSDFLLANSVGSSVARIPTGTSIFDIASELSLSGAANWQANGTTAVSLTALAPAGANPTVREWLKIKNASGAIRYIPTF